MEADSYLVVNAGKVIVGVDVTMAREGWASIVLTYADASTHVSHHTDSGLAIQWALVVLSPLGEDRLLKVFMQAAEDEHASLRASGSLNPVCG